jgi:SAM-dependent methyltransferase
MGFISVLGQAHEFVRQRLHPGDIAVDATAGNGVDTLFLAQRVGKRGHVYAFDIQQQALTNTRERLEKAGVLANVILIHDSHARLLDHLPETVHGQVAAVMFNFGYLPGGDPSVITQIESSLSALKAALKVLKTGGIISAVLYRGHPGGEEEARAIYDFVSNLPSDRYEVYNYRPLNRRNAPELVAIGLKASKSSKP